jgi:hypothetical protein
MAERTIARRQLAFKGVSACNLMLAVASGALIVALDCYRSHRIGLVDGMFYSPRALDAEMMSYLCTGGSSRRGNLKTAKKKLIVHFRHPLSDYATM